jgi:hypothetical protein
MAYPEKTMKRILWSLAVSLVIGPFVSAQTAATDPGKITAAQPVYIYLYSRVTDQVNLDITVARLHRLLPMIERYRKQYPEAHVTATIFFSGASSEALARSNARTGIVNYVLGYKKRGIIQIGYDGTDEPTYTNRPMVQSINTKPYKERWMDRASADEKFLTEGSNPLTGAPEPGTAGGLKAMQQIFGEAACIVGVSVGQEDPAGTGHPGMPGVGATPTITPEVGDWEVVPLLRRINAEAILGGVPASNPAHIPGFGGGVMGLGRIMSPVPDASPELYWADDILRISESGGRGARVIHGYDGAPALKEFSAKLDRSDIRIIHMELGSENDYLKPDFAKSQLSPALTYAYAHPDSPELPANARLSAEGVDAAYAKETEALNWLASDFFPANPGSRFVSDRDLQQMTGPSKGYSVSIDTLRSALKTTLSDMGSNTYLPSYFKVGNHYLSLADTFQVLTDSLAEFSRTGKLPESVRVAGIYGPIGLPGWHGQNIGDVTVASVAQVCAQIDGGLHDTTGYPMPTDTVPPILSVDKIPVNAAQFLRLMAEAVVDPSSDAQLRIRMTYMAPPTAVLFPKTRSMEDMGATWTFKPAPLEDPASMRASR